MTPDKILDFLNKGGVLAFAILTCTYAFIKIDRLETKTDTLQAVVIDCYKERLEDVSMMNMNASFPMPQRTETYAIIPNNPVGEIKRKC